MRRRMPRRQETEMKKICFITIMAISISCGSRQGHEDASMRVIEIEHGGMARSCLVHVPGNRTQGPAPLLIVLHGGGGTAQGLVKLTKERFNELSDQAGFYAAYPSGTGKSWNDFRDDSKTYAHQHGVDDVGFVGALIDRLAAEYPIDRNRIFAAGMSNGGLMAFRLACSLPAIRGIAAVAATHPLDQEGKCAPSGPMSVLIINGTDDPIIPYDGGDIKLLGTKRGRVVPTETTVNYWTRFNKCRGSGKEKMLPDSDPDDRTRVKTVTYDECEGGARVVLYRVEGGGHAWPGGKHYIFSSIIGHTSGDFSACDAIWGFFNAVR